MNFDSNDLFPLQETGISNYAQAKQHSELVDRYLGFEISKIENHLREGSSYPQQETWKHIDPQSFQTPYSELRWMLHLLQPPDGSTIVDLGCAYGRMAFVIGKHYPSVKFVGYELVEERVREGQRILSKHNYPLCSLETKNLELTKPPVADFYFIYDFGRQDLIAKTLLDLQSVAIARRSEAAEAKRSIVVVARGRGTRSLIQSEHLWLSVVNDPLHTEHFSIYRS